MSLGSLAQSGSRSRAGAGSGDGGGDELGRTDYGRKGGVKGKERERSRDDMVANDVLDVPPARAPFSTNLSSPINPSTPIPSRIKRSHTGNTLRVPPSPSPSTTSSYLGSASGSGSATPRSASFPRHSVRATAKPLDLKAEFDQQERDRVARGKDKKKLLDKGKGKANEEAGPASAIVSGQDGLIASGLGRKKSTMMLGGLSKGLGRMGSVMRKREPPNAQSTSNGDTMGRTSNIPTSGSKGKLSVQDGSPGSLSASTRHLMGNTSGSLRSASAQGSLRERGAPSERMGSVREEDDASFLSYARGGTPVRAASAFSHKRMGSQASSSSRPKTSTELAQGKNRKGEQEGDAGITMPFSTQHDLHVSPELHDLPPAWLQTLKDQGMSAQDLLLIAAARNKQLAARSKGSRGTHSSHGSFSGSITQLSRDSGGQSSTPEAKPRNIKTSRSLPRLSVSDSYVSRTSDGSAGTGTNGAHSGVSDGANHRRSWLGKKGMLSPITSHKEPMSSPTSPGPPTASTSATFTGPTSPVFTSLLLAHKQGQNGQASHVETSSSRARSAEKRRLSDQLRGFANLSLDEDAGWAEGVLGLMQSGAGDETAKGSSNETRAAPSTTEAVQADHAGQGSHSIGKTSEAREYSPAPQFQIKVEEADEVDQPQPTEAKAFVEEEEPLSREGHTDASYFAALSMRDRKRAIGLISKHGIDPTAISSSLAPAQSLATISSISLPRSPDRSAVTPAIAHHKLAPSPSPPLMPLPIALASDAPARHIDGPPMRIASPPLDRLDRSRTSTPEHLTSRLRKASSTELLSKYGPNPYAPPRSALPSPPQPGVEIKYSPRPPFRQATKATSSGGGLPNAEFGKSAASKHVRPKTAPKGTHLRRPSPSAGPGSTSDSGMPLRSTGVRHRFGHKHVASTDTAASAEVVTPGGTDEGRTPRPGDKGSSHAARTRPAPQDDDLTPEDRVDCVMVADHLRDCSKAPSRPTLRNEDSAGSSAGGTGLGLGLVARNGSPQRLAMRSRRNTQASLPASAADTDELFLPDDEELSSIPDGTQRISNKGNAGTPMSTEGEGGGAASPRMSLKTYMFEPDSDDAYSAFGGVDIPDVPDMPVKDDSIPGLMASKSASAGMSPGREHKHSAHRADGSNTCRLSLYYRTPPEGSPEIPSDAPLLANGSYSPVQRSKQRLSLGESARPLSFSAPYASMRAEKADGKVGALLPGNGVDDIKSSAAFQAESKAGDMLSPLPSGQDAKDRSRRSSRASRASRISRRSRTSLKSNSATANPSAVAIGTGEDVESSNTLVASSLNSDRRTKRVSALSAFSSRSGMSGFSSLGDSDSDLHDLRDLEDFDQDEHHVQGSDGAGGRRGAGLGVVREARMTHVGAAPGRASIFALNGLGIASGSRAEHALDEGVGAQARARDEGGELRNE